MEVSGKVKKIEAVKTFGSSGFRKRELIIVTEEQYPQFLSIEFVQDKCDLLDSLKEGDLVKIGINLRGREWVNPEGETKYFNSIQGWKVEKGQNQTASTNPPVESVGKFETTGSYSDEDPDDLPF
ncbi:MAG: DUF3127 domain-containing protein [Flavobacteriaceae bacterium]|nr:DUF3127 domain-containing protein [Flavobacteriaceae bacterium]